MNIKEKLIEELEKDNWYIDTYYCMDRLNAIAQLYPKIKELMVANYVRMQSRYLCGTKNDWLFLSEPSEREKDLTQLANEYLEEYQPEIWIRSVLAAIQLGLKVEMKGLNAYRDEQWLNVRSGNTIMLSLEAEYRVNYEESKLIPAEVWELLDDEMQYAAKDPDGEVFAYSLEPKHDDHFDAWTIKEGCKMANITYLKALKDAPIFQVDWKDSLCTRSKK